MTPLAAQPWLAVAVPVALAIVVVALAPLLRRRVAWIAALAPLTVLAVAAACFPEVMQGQEVASGAWGGGSGWLVGLDRPILTVGYAVDGLTVVMLAVVGVVALMVVVFSIGYMAEDPAQGRYFGLLALFTAAMSLLVLAGDLVTLIIGWELVGACSYLLIGFWFRKPSAASAALKAFLVTHVGDAGMLLGIALLFASGASLSFSELGTRPIAPLVATAAALLLLLGAVGKSAQFPLHFWLPDAMEGPTPVSALIHAATMVAAGVYLLARLAPLFRMAPAALTVVLVLGTFTAVMAATIAVAQSDIKKVLAYSTISQLGFMFAAIGVGAWPAAIFHLVTHAAFKALLFLGAGSVIHATDTQELAEMGGLARKMPLTTTTWVVGGLALAGVPPLAGFFSKDAVVASVLHASPVAGAALLGASLLTAFYIARATRLAFFGVQRGDFHAHEGGLVMTAPLMILAACALGLGPAGAPLARLLGEAPEALEAGVAVTAVVLAAAGLAAGWMLYRRGPEADESLARPLGATWDGMRTGYGYDAAVSRFVVRPALGLARSTYDVADRGLIDRAVEGSASIAARLGGWLSGLQSGDAQWYAALVGAGVIVLLAVGLLAAGR